MQTWLFLLAISTVVLLALMQQNGVDLAQLLASSFGARRPRTSLRPTAADGYSYLAAFAVVLLVIFVALSPESRLLLTVIDAIGFDVLVALFAFELRSLVRGAFDSTRLHFVRARRWFWTPGVGPHPKLAVGVVCGTYIYIGIWVTASVIRG